MADFWTDLNREIAAYETAERADEIDRAMKDENSDYAVNGEAANLIPANDVLNPDEPVWFNRVEGCDLIMSYRPGQYGDEWGRD